MTATGAGDGEPDGAAAVALLDKLRDFAVGLTPGERRLLAALVAPGVEAAWAEAPEVSGFEWRAARLPEHLAAAVRQRELRVHGW